MPVPPVIEGHGRKRPREGGVTARPIIIVGGMRLQLSWAYVRAPSNDRPPHRGAPSNDNWHPVGAA